AEGEKETDLRPPLADEGGRRRPYRDEGEQQGDGADGGEHQGEAPGQAGVGLARLEERPCLDAGDPGLDGARDLVQTLRLGPHRDALETPAPSPPRPRGGAASPRAPPGLPPHLREL